MSAKQQSSLLTTDDSEGLAFAAGIRALLEARPPNPTGAIARRASVQRLLQSWFERVGNDEYVRWLYQDVGITVASARRFWPGLPGDDAVRNAEHRLKKKMRRAGLRLAHQQVATVARSKLEDIDPRLRRHFQLLMCIAVFDEALAAVGALRAEDIQILRGVSKKIDKIIDGVQGIAVSH